MPLCARSTRLRVRVPFVDAYSRGRDDGGDVRRLHAVRHNNNARAGCDGRHVFSRQKCLWIGNELRRGDSSNSAASARLYGVISGVRRFTYGERLNEGCSNRVEVQRRRIYDERVPNRFGKGDLERRLMFSVGNDDGARGAERTRCELELSLGPFALIGETFRAAPQLFLALNFPLKPASFAIIDLALEAPIAEKESVFGDSFMVVAEAGNTTDDDAPASAAAPGISC